VNRFICVGYSLVPCLADSLACGSMSLSDIYPLRSNALWVDVLSWAYLICPVKLLVKPFFSLFGWLIWLVLVLHAGDLTVCYEDYVLFSEFLGYNWFYIWLRPLIPSITGMFIWFLRWLWVEGLLFRCACPLGWLLVLLSVCCLLNELSGLAGLWVACLLLSIIGLPILLVFELILHWSSPYPCYSCWCLLLILIYPLDPYIWSSTVLLLVTYP
jgi:hypothetical protein